MADRYFVPDPIKGDRARIVDDQAHHLAHVMRARPGDKVVLFDGSGSEWKARVTHVGRSDVELELLARREVDRELPCELTLAVALPKGDRQQWLVEKAVELGVRRLVPLTTARGVAQPTDKSLIRLRRAVIEASKQCGRNRLLEIAAPVSCSDYFAQQEPSVAARALADRSGTQTLAAFFSQYCSSTPTAIRFAVGPEGGFIHDEIAAARSHGWAIIGLGPRILRVETAAICLAAAGAVMAMG
jgi:16S rRNA (uracil1498-N3)-methyltransferase